MIGLWSNDKVRVAFLSLLASISITIMNITAWLLTNSVAVLAESVHTALDIVITTITLIAVNVGSKPPDKEHPYGHGKAESIGGLFGSLFMILAGLLVGYESAEKLIMRIPFKPDIVAIIVLSIAIIIDTNRSRALGKAARRWNSRALEADSYHFKSDVFISTSIVAIMIAGLIMNTYYPGIFDYWGTIIDAVAAFAIIIYFSIVGARLLKTSVDELMDRTSEELINRIREVVLSVPNVTGISDIKARRIGTMTHVELTIKVPDYFNIAEAHQVADNVENTIKRTLGPSMIMVHIEPTLYNKVEKALNSIIGLSLIKNIHEVNIVSDKEGNILVTMHVMLDSNLTLDETQEVLNKIEQVIKDVIPGSKVWIHIEPYRVGVDNLREDDLRIIVEKLVSRYGGQVRDVEVINIQDLRMIRVLIALPKGTTILNAHNIATEVESELAKIYAMPGHIVVSVMASS